MRLDSKALVVIALTLAVESASACFVPKRGYDWGADKLIDQSQSIVLAVLVEKETGPNGESRSRLKTIEALKGDAPKFVEFFSDAGQHYGQDFDKHTDDRFWAANVGRSEFPCCICGPDHTFIEGETYLLFPDAFGAMKSAEIIRAPSDKWLQYVRDALERS